MNGSLLVKRSTHRNQGILVTLLLYIAVCHSPLEIKIMIKVMIIMEVSTAPLSSKEPGGTRIVTAQILMVYIFVEVIPPLPME